MAEASASRAQGQNLDHASGVAQGFAFEIWRTILRTEFWKLRRWMRNFLANKLKDPMLRDAAFLFVVRVDSAGLAYGIQVFFA